MIRGQTDAVSWCIHRQRTASIRKRKMRNGHGAGLQGLHVSVPTHSRGGVSTRMKMCTYERLQGRSVTHSQLALQSSARHFQRYIRHHVPHIKRAVLNLKHQNEYPRSMDLGTSECGFKCFLALMGNCVLYFVGQHFVNSWCQKLPEFCIFNGSFRSLS